MAPDELRLGAAKAPHDHSLEASEPHTQSLKPESGPKDPQPDPWVDPRIAIAGLKKRLEHKVGLAVDLANKLGEAEDRRAAAGQVIERLRADLKREHEKLEDSCAATERAAKRLEEAEGKIDTYRADLDEAVDIAHRLLARLHPNTFSYFRERTGDMFLRGREMLKKHGRYEGT